MSSNPAQYASAMDAVETGIVNAFSARVMALATDWSGFDLVLACCAGFAVQQALGGSYRPSRAVHALARVLRGIVLKAVLTAAVAKDTPVYMAHLLCLFLLLHAFDADGLGSQAKYVFASQIAQAFAPDPFVGFALCAALQVNMAVLSATPRLQECAQLVVAQLVVQWFQDSIPDGMEFATTLLFMYMVSPMVKQESPILTDLYVVSLYQVSGTIQLPGAEPWVQAAYAGLLWKLSRDPVSALVGQFSCVQVGSQIILGAGATLLRTDPILAAWFILTGMGVVLTLAG